MRYDENISVVHPGRLAYVKLHEFWRETMYCWKQLSEKGCIQCLWKFFFAHMNCLDCKKLLSCLAVLWKGPCWSFTVRLTIKDIGLIGVNKNVANAMLV